MVASRRMWTNERQQRPARRIGRVLDEPRSAPGRSLKRVVGSALPDRRIATQRRDAVTASWGSCAAVKHEATRRGAVSIRCGYSVGRGGGKLGVGGRAAVWLS